MHGGIQLWAAMEIIFQFKGGYINMGTGIPGGKLMPTGEAYLGAAGPCLKYLKLYITKKNNQNKEIDIPISDDCYQVGLLFKKSSSGNIELFKGHWKGPRVVPDNQPFATLTPQEYE